MRLSIAAIVIALSLFGITSVVQAQYQPDLQGQHMFNSIGQNALQQRLLGQWFLDQHRPNPLASLLSVAVGVVVGLGIARYVAKHHP